jgi:uroporphyrin-III C-methyltransferase/precorrin-2 dehydrogenase/sirohydrochlorin ferrochelatase
MNDPRTPSESRPQRMQPLARLPVFVALVGKRAVVAGGTAPAAWKAELLSAAGAHVQVFAQAPSEEMLNVAADVANGTIEIVRRDWTADDLAGAAMAIGACENEEDAARFAQAARAAGVPVNVIDKPAFCDFAFGAIVNRSPLVVGISTDGAAPVFGQMVRAKIEAMLPAGFARWAQAAQTWRRQLQSAGLTFNARRRFWQMFTAQAVVDPNAEPELADFERLLSAVRGEGDKPEGGSVTLVGAGPGDPELLTLRAVRALQSADVILFDDLVSGEILDFARREARKMLVGKTGYGPSCKQSDINELMVSLARAGRRVVRLKGGDPMIFGRAGEELDACEAANIPVEVVPGITAAQGVASQLAVSLTNRDQVRRVQYITGHSRKGALPTDLNWKSLTDPGATTAIYMPTKTLAEFVATAMREGLDPQLPAVAVARATRPDQAVIASAIANLPSRLAVEAPDGPVLVMIGQVFAAQVAAKMSLRQREA